MPVITVRLLQFSTYSAQCKMRNTIFWALYSRNEENCSWPTNQQTKRSSRSSTSNDGGGEVFRIFHPVFCCWVGFCCCYCCSRVLPNYIAGFFLPRHNFISFSLHKIYTEKGIFQLLSGTRTVITFCLINSFFSTHASSSVHTL